MAKTSVSLAGIKAAIFDMDGTMINNAAHHRKAWQTFLAKHHIVLTEEEFHHKISGRKNDQILEIAFGRKLDPQEVATFADEKEALYRELYKKDIEEIKGLSQVIDELHRRGIKTAIATTAPIKNRDFALEALDLQGKFEVILGEEHVSHGKPHPEIYLVAAKELSVSPPECIVFEDSPPGVESGKSAGMTVIGILSSHSSEALSKCDYHAADFSQIQFTE